MISREASLPEPYKIKKKSNLITRGKHKTQNGKFEWEVTKNGGRLYTYYFSI